MNFVLAVFRAWDISSMLYAGEAPFTRAPTENGQRLETQMTSFVLTCANDRPHGNRVPDGIRRKQRDRITRFEAIFLSQR